MHATMSVQPWTGVMINANVNVPAVVHLSSLYVSNMAVANKA